MSFYLLDTHIVLWWFSNDKQLIKKIKDEIADPENHILVSSASIWEISIKKSLGKLKAPNNLKNIIESEFEFLTITADHAQQVALLPPIHSDPFDRIIIAQAMVEKITLITADTIIPRYDVTIFK
jgi:PIN domain nuclease of toxin-antitoxin system